MASHKTDRKSTPPTPPLSRSSISSAATTPTNASSTLQPTSSSSYFTFPVTYAVSGLLRRLSADSPAPSSRNNSSSSSRHRQSPLSNSISSDRFDGSIDSSISSSMPTSSFFAAITMPPLVPLALEGFKAATPDSARLLSRSVAEEIRLLLPPRLQLVEQWKLLFSLEQDGVSLATLYEKCDEARGKRGGFVLVIKDTAGGVFGAYLSDAPHPSPHYYGTGECFLWRASVLPSMLDLSSLPLPPSADTTNAQRTTTLLRLSENGKSTGTSTNGTSTPDRIRFKAFPYSGVNDYMIFCESSYLSVGGGDGHYGLWLDDNLETGVSSTCPTFGNEPLSDEGSKFEVLGVEIWYCGA